MSCSKFLLIEGLNTKSRRETRVYPQTPQSLSSDTTESILRHNRVYPQTPHSLPTYTTESSSMNVEYKKQRSSELDTFHG